MNWKTIGALGLVIVAAGCTPDPVGPVSAAGPHVADPAYAYAGSPASFSTTWFQGFEIDAVDWSPQVTRVPTGTNGVASATGAFHGAAASGAFTRFNAYSSVWPGDYSAEIDVYLDPSWAVGQGFDYSVASNGITNAHRRDFIFHVGVHADGRLLVNGSNNSDGTVNDYSLVNDGDGTPYEVITAGWYKLQHVFYNDGGVLAVDLRLLSSSGTLLFTTTRKDLSDVIGTTVGGHRYGWFVFSTRTLAVDNQRLATVALQAPSTFNLTVTPSSPVFDANNVLGVSADAADGFESGSFASNGTAKTDMYFTPEALFAGREISVGQVARMSYWTKTGVLHSVNAADWFMAIYTKSFAGQASTSSWYGSRFGTEPYFSANILDPANTWNHWSTNLAANTLRFFESTAGYFGSYTDPSWAEFIASPSLGTTVQRASQKILFFTIQTGNAWATGFTGQLDGLRIELTDGSVATVNFEPNPPPCTTDCYADNATGNDANGGTSAADAKKTIQAAVNQVSVGGTVHVAAGSYPEQVVVNKDITVTGAGQASTVLTGPPVCSGTGIALGASSSGSTIQDIGITGFSLGIQMLTGPLSNITVQDVTSSNNCLHGIWVQAFGTTNLTFNRVTANGNGIGAGGRGIWMINGVKSGITITDGTFSSNGLVGIDVSDGNVTGLTITGNTVSGNGDSGIGFLGATGPNANLVANNTVTNNGRYGIEVKIPTGNGAASGAGSVVVRDNVVSRTVAALDPRDYAGIAVFRRSVTVPINADQPSGVFVTGNTVSGFKRKPSGSTGDGFGIVVEGTGHLVTKNIVSGNDVGIQIQSGNTADVQSTDYFDRGNAAPSSALINRNSITGNTSLAIRNVGAGVTDATCNWFGAAAGPVAADVSGSLTTTPWLLSAVLTSNCSNAPPTVLTAAADAFENEGSTLSTSGSFNGVGLTLTASAAVGTFTPNNAAGTWTWSLSTTDNVALATMNVTATNAYGTSVSDQFDYRATNVAPSLTITAPADGSIYAIGAPVGLTSTFTDPGTADTHTCSYAWGDALTTGPVASGVGTCNTSHTFTAAGIYNIAVTVRDDDGGFDTKNVMVIVYDPSAGFVTGGGWINSPAGAYDAIPSLTGKASFGFVAKYVKGKTTPSGDTEFQFKAGNLNFSSTSIDWLVVAGPKAQFKGSGTINGGGVYRFMLTAIDGQVAGGGGTDKFRIRIWNDVSGSLVYDNQKGDSDSADPNTVIGGGNIVIHK